MSNLTLTSLTPDDGYWFGLGVFETIWVKQNTAVFLDEHLNRLKKSALFLGFLPDKTCQSMDFNSETGNPGLFKRKSDGKRCVKINTFR